VQLIHTCYRITNPEKSVAFYEALGFEKLRELPIGETWSTSSWASPATPTGSS
jgi:catechol 2,3-dioxygenase-like lactoylglutathione lyase family enzyme